MGKAMIKQVLLSFLFVGCAHNLSAASCVQAHTLTPKTASFIYLVPDSTVPSSVVGRAIEIWKGCTHKGAMYGEDFPPLRQGEHLNDRVGLVVTYVEHAPTGRCGYFQGRTITLYGYAKVTGGSGIEWVHCGGGDNANTLAHEIGHFYGLVDQYGPRCDTDIMGQQYRERVDSRHPQRAECRSVADKWNTER